MLLHKTDRLWICKNNRELRKWRSGYFCCSKSLVTRIQLGVIMKLTKHTETALTHIPHLEKFVASAKQISRIIHVVNSKY